MAVEFLKDELDKKMEERRAKFRESGGAGVFDRGALEATQPGESLDPGKRYRYVNSDPRRVSHFKDKGYTVEKKVRPKSGVKKEDGSWTLPGGDVLMSAPMDKYLDNVADAAFRGELRESSGREQALERINKMARDGKVAKPHEDVAFDESKQE